jgi:hypothetical protein
MNTQRKHEILNELDTLRKQVDLLESYHTLGMANDDQYQETGLTIQRRVSELEEECGINKPIITSQGILYNDDAELFESEYQKQIIKNIEEIENERRNS